MMIVCPRSKRCNWEIYEMEWSITILAVVRFYSRIVIRKLPQNCLCKFRKVENELKSYTKKKADLNYLKFCSTNQLLPKFVNFNLYDVSAENEPETISFKEKLLQREIRKKEQEAEEHIKESMKLIIDLRSCLSSFKFYAAVLYTYRTLNQLSCETEWTHERKLKILYIGKIYLPRDSINIVNLTDHSLDRRRKPSP